MKHEMTYEELLKIGERQLAVSGVSENILDAWLLMEYAFSISKSWYYLHGRECAEPKAAEHYLALIQERAKRIPLQHITGQAWFMGREFYVDGRVLIPRQDTEILVEEALGYLKQGERILDMCTGSGCILLSLLAEREECWGTGVDLSEDALAVARKNQEKIGIDSRRAAFQESNLFANVSGTYDMVVSNPPYIPSEEILKLAPEVKEHDPLMALDGREDGLWFYQKITEEVSSYLKSGGWLLYEIGYDQGRDVSEILAQNGFTEIQVKKDYAGLDRVVKGRLR